MRQRSFRLNKTILLIVAVIYSAFLVLLLCMDLYLLQQNLSGIRQKERTALADYVETMDGDLDSIDLFLYDIFANNKDFSALQWPQEDQLEEFQSAWSLNETLKGRLFIDKDLSGYALLYRGGAEAMYWVDETHIPTQTAKAIREQLGGYFEDGTARQWFIQEADSTVYMAIMLRKGEVAVYGIYDLGRVEDELKERVTGPAIQVMLYDGSKAIYGKDLAGELGLSEIIGSHLDIFEEDVHGRCVDGIRVPDTDLWVCAAYEVSPLNTLNPLAAVLLSLTLLSIGGACLLYYFIRKHIFVPLQRLTDSMNLVRTGDVREIPRLPCRAQEIQEMNDTLREMIRALEKQRILAYEEAAERQKVQLQYLLLQLKPHFYLNGLKTLNALIYERELDKAHDLILKLSKYLRYLLNVDREITALQEEIAFVQNYIDMQHCVSSRELSSEISCEEGAGTWKVPLLVIQTFVENSVKYAGAGPKGERLSIQIRAELLDIGEKRVLSICIQDNGTGYPQEVLKELASEKYSGRFCVGIKNLCQRCRLLYGEDAHFSFFNDSGARSELILPEEPRESGREPVGGEIPPKEPLGITEGETGGGTASLEGASGSPGGERGGVEIPPMEQLGTTEGERGGVEIPSEEVG